MARLVQLKFDFPQGVFRLFLMIFVRMFAFFLLSICHCLGVLDSSNDAQKYLLQQCSTAHCSKQPILSGTTQILKKNGNSEPSQRPGGFRKSS